MMMKTMVMTVGKALAEKVDRTPEDDEMRSLIETEADSERKQPFFYWALQYGMYVEVLEPVSLRSKIAETVSEMNKKYHRNGV